MKPANRHRAISLCVAAALSQSVWAEEADNVEVVTVTGYQQNIINAPASITVIEQADLINKPYRDITQALQDVPGIFAENGPGSKGGSSEVSLRGMSSKYALILVNGKPQGSGQAYYNGYGRGAEFGWLPPLSSIERIEVIRGPMSSLYGSDALGGVINVITKTSALEWQGEISADTVIHANDESGASQQYRYFVTGPMGSDDLTLSLTGNLYKRDEDHIERGYKKSDSLNNTAKLNWHVDNDQSVQFEAGFADQEQLGTAEKSGERELKTKREFYALNHDISWSGINTQSYIQTETLENETQVSEYQRTTFNTLSHMPLGDSQLVFGGQYREQSTKNPLRAKNKANLERTDMAVFAESHWQLTDKFNLTTGLRWVDDENYGDELVPRAYGVYTFSDNLSIKGGVSRGYRTPDLKQGDSQWVEGGGGRRIDGADIGNSDLKPEYSVNYEIALNWLGENGLSAGITAYQTDFEDRIQKNIICSESSEKAYDCSYLGTPYQRVYQYQNVAEAELNGIESFVRYVKGAFSTSVNYTYTDSEIKSGSKLGEPLNNYPKSMINLSLTWQPGDNFDVWSKVKYRSATLEDGEDEIPAYTIVDIGGSYYFSDDLNAYLGIYNLMDEEISYQEYSRVLDGRRYSLGLRYSF